MKGPQEQYVALWHHFGSAVMGRAWCCKGKIVVAFLRCSPKYLRQRLDPTTVGGPTEKPQQSMRPSDIQYTSDLTRHAFSSSTMKGMNTWA
ncbi:unnamed protein product [Toxocara canis]|uniref:Uncharacterized protein n=1 Tax=Toxocara canis TaxID=6265 RepID=A0A183UM65_TOXCA|nr:unnamed protein product [Toxocara canis]